MPQAIISYTYQATDHGHKDGKVGVYDIEAEILVVIRHLPEGMDGAFAAKILIGADLDCLKTSDPVFSAIGNRIASDAFNDETFLDDVKKAFGIEWKAAPELLEALLHAEAALADIGDAEREPGDDVAWCESRAKMPLAGVRAAIARAKGVAA